jgi:hypothetical protein
MNNLDNFSEFLNEKVEKDVCLPGTKVIVNDKFIKWNSELGAKNNGLFAFIYKMTRPSDKNFEIPVGTVLEILNKPKQYQEAGVQIPFKIEGDERIFASYWVNFKHKVDLI